MKSSIASKTETAAPARATYVKQLAEWVETYASHAPSSAEQALSTPGDNLRAVQYKAGNEPLNAALTVIINDALEVVGQSSQNKIVVVGKVIKQKYWHLRLSEIAMVFQKGVSGHYGNVPSGSNPLLYWIAKYDEEERTNYCMSRAAAHKESYEKYQQQLDREANRDFSQMVKDNIRRKQASQLAQDHIDKQKKKNE